jgi:glutamyl-Q tRNA(Asp) synthetase
MGSLVAALASWLDAKANQGQWLIRIEDIDKERCQNRYSQLIIEQLSKCGLRHDGEIVYQSQRQRVYETYIKKLKQHDLLYRCLCSRANIWRALNQANDESYAQSLIYPGTCRESSLHAPSSEKELGIKDSDKVEKPFSLRIKTMNQPFQWRDRRMGEQIQNIFTQVGDFIIKRSDGPYSYQLCVVADDIEQSVTHVVRGEDLLDNTPRQNYLYQLFNQSPPIYLHVPLVKNNQGEKLSKQNFAPSIDLETTQSTLTTMQSAAIFLGLHPTIKPNSSLSEHLLDWTRQWSLKFPLNLSNA